MAGTELLVLLGLASLLLPAGCAYGPRDAVFGRDAGLPARRAVGVDLILPLQELALGFKQQLLADPAGVVPQYGPALRQYLLAHFHATAPDGHTRGRWRSVICR